MHNETLPYMNVLMIYALAAFTLSVTPLAQHNTGLSVVDQTSDQPASKHSLIIRIT